MQTIWPQSYIPNYDEYVKISDIIKVTTLFYNPYYSRSNNSFNPNEWAVNLKAILNAPSYTIEELKNMG